MMTDMPRVALHVIAILVGVLAGLAWIDDQKQRPTYHPRHCVLVIPPSHVAREPRIEAAYMGEARWPGWLIVAEAVACD